MYSQGAPNIETARQGGSERKLTLCRPDRIYDRCGRARVLCIWHAPCDVQIGATEQEKTRQDERNETPPHPEGREAETHLPVSMRTEKS